MTTYAGAQRKAGLALWGAVGSLGVAAGVLARRRPDDLGRAGSPSSGSTCPIGVVALARRPPRHRQGRRGPTAACADFDLPGAVTVIGGLATLIYALGGTATHGWWSVQTVPACSVVRRPAGRVPQLEQRARQAAVPAARLEARQPWSPARP